MSDVKIIFWDLYGTLIAAQRGNLDGLLRREAELRPAFERTAKNFGLQGDPAVWHDLFLRGIQAERASGEARGVAHPEVRVDEIWLKLLEKFQVEKPPTISFAREVALYFERQANPAQLQARAFDTLTAFKKRGVRHGIVSNAQFYTPIVLSQLLSDESACAICTYESIFDVSLVFFSFELGVAKPDLAVFRRVVEALSREKILPDDCVYVGSSPVEDIAPAQHVGFKTVLFAPESVPECAKAPDLVIHNLAQLLEWL